MGNFIESLLEPLTGRKPKVPDLPPVDAARAQADAIAGNQAALPGAQELATGVNKFNVSQRLGMLKQALDAIAPGSFEQVGRNVSAQTRGEIPADVAQQIQRNSSLQALRGGFGGGSTLGRNLTARDFGLTSLDMMDRGFANFNTLANLTDTPQFDATSMFFSPQQRLQHALGERDVQFNRNWLQEQIDAAPSPLGQFVQNVVYAVAGTAGRSFGVSGGGGGGVGGPGGTGMSSGSTGMSSPNYITPL